jgi:hypothetical protein
MVKRVRIDKLFHLKFGIVQTTLLQVKYVPLQLSYQCLIYLSFISWF